MSQVRDILFESFKVELYQIIFIIDFTADEFLHDSFKLPENSEGFPL